MSVELDWRVIGKRQSYSANVEEHVKINPSVRYFDLLHTIIFPCYISGGVGAWTGASSSFVLFLRVQQGNYGALRQERYSIDDLET